MEKQERWNNYQKSLMFLGIVLLTLVVFFGIFWLFFIKLAFYWIVALICCVVVFEIYLNVVLNFIISFIKKNRYK